MKLTCSRLSTRCFPAALMSAQRRASCEAPAESRRPTTRSNAARSSGGPARIWNESGMARLLREVGKRARIEGHHGDVPFGRARVVRNETHATVDDVEAD